jgi:HEAT repeat protein
MAEKNKNNNIDGVIDALLDQSTPFPPTYLHGLSDLNAAELRKLQSVWEQITPDRRTALLQDLEALTERDTLVYFDDIARFALKDSDPRARAASIRLLSDAEDTKLIPQFVRMMEKDPSPEVRAEAASGLGAYVYLGELDEINLVAVLVGSDVSDVRRAALESFSFSSRPEAAEWIKRAYQMQELRWRGSALMSMGRSADNVWESIVLKHIDDPIPELQFEAVRAAGGLDLTAARQPLMELLEDPEALDDDVRLAAVWSLSQIGGEDVAQLLEQLLENTDDEDETSFIEDAIENLELTEGLGLFDLVNVEAPREDDLDDIIDVTEEHKDGDEDEDLIERR